MENLNNMIPDYLADRLNEQEKSMFESALKQNENLRQAVEAEKSTNLENAAEENETEDIKNESLNTDNQAITDDFELKPNKKIAYYMAFFVAFTLLFIAYAWFSKKERPKEFFDKNAGLPSSLFEDVADRNQQLSDQDSTEAHSEFCQTFLQQAETFYNQKQYEDAQKPLLMMTEDQSGACASEGWFYLGLLRLRLNDPETAVQCFVKVEDLQRFGTDVQWYLAVAYARMAMSNPFQKEMAIRGLERMINSEQSEKRKTEAKLMLDILK